MENPFMLRHKKRHKMMAVRDLSRPWNIQIRLQYFRLYVSCLTFKAISSHFGGGFYEILNGRLI